MASTEQPNNIPFGAVINPHLIPLASHNNDEGEEFPAIIDEFTISEFIAGYCSYLAIALHEATDWDIYEEYQFNEINNEYDHIHTWVKNSEGNAVDILGIHKGNWAATQYSKLTSNSIILKTVITNDSYYQKINNNSCEILEWARDLVKKYPTYFGIIN